jgi:SAM-dependent methyltransferase
VFEVPGRLRRTAHHGEEGWLDSARHLVDLVTRQCGLRDLASTSVLDVGCGTKISKVLLEDPLPIGRYVGVDVDAHVIELLETAVDDPRFSFHHIDVQNDLYNPEGRPLGDRSELPLGDERFDIIWLFSVFTHLAPNDYAALLRLLRRYVRNDGWLVFSLYINEVTRTGFAPLDWRAYPAEAERERLARAIARQRAELGDAWFWQEFDRHATTMGEEWLAVELPLWMDSADDATRAGLERRCAAHGIVLTDLVASESSASSLSLFADESGTLTSNGEPPDFLDLIPEQPLMQAVYSRRHALELFEGTGWQVVSLNRPEPDYIQHYFVCRPS